MDKRSYYDEMELSWDYRALHAPARKNGGDADGAHEKDPSEQDTLPDAPALVLEESADDARAETTQQKASNDTEALASPAQIVQDRYIAPAPAVTHVSLGRRIWWKVKDFTGTLVTILILSLLATALYAYVTQNNIDIREWLQDLLSFLG